MSEEFVTGWEIDHDDRMRLLDELSPAYPYVVADHVTLRMHVGADAPLPPPVTGEIVGRADDGSGVQAMVVRIDGTTDRPGGGTYHSTWSLGAGRDGIESNDVIAALGWTPLASPLPVKLHPKRFG